MHPVPRPFPQRPISNYYGQEDRLSINVPTVGYWPKNRIGAPQAVIDNYLTYQIIKKITLPWPRWNAFETGVIDAKGNIIVAPQNRTPVQNASFTKYDLLMLRLKKLLEIAPGGRSILQNVLTAINLIHEQANARAQMILEQKKIVMKIPGGQQKRDPYAKSLQHDIYKPKVVKAKNKYSRKGRRNNRLNALQEKIVAAVWGGKHLQTQKDYDNFGGRHFDARYDATAKRHANLIKHYSNYSDDEKQAIKQYNVSSGTFNKKLIRGKPLTDDKHIKLDKHLTSAVERHTTPKHMIVHTGLSFSPEKFIPKNHDGKQPIEFHTKGFLSATIDHLVPHTFTKRPKTKTKYSFDKGEKTDNIYPVRTKVPSQLDKTHKDYNFQKYEHHLHISVPKGSSGAYAGAYDKFDREKELILHKNAKIHIDPNPHVVHNYIGMSRGTVHWTGRLVHDGTKDVSKNHINEKFVPGVWSGPQNAKRFIDLTAQERAKISARREKVRKGLNSRHDKLSAHYSKYTPAEENHIRLYKEKSQDLNAALHAGHGSIKGTTKQHQQLAKIDAHLHTAAQKHATPKHMIVHSGLSFDPTKYPREGNKIKMMRNKYTSTSIDSTTASDFVSDNRPAAVVKGTGEQYHMLHVSVPKGSHGVYTKEYGPSEYGDSDPEREFIIHKHATIHIDPKPHTIKHNDHVMFHWHGKLVHDGFKDMSKNHLKEDEGGAPTNSVGTGVGSDTSEPVKGYAPLLLKIARRKIKKDKEANKRV